MSIDPSVQKSASNDKGVDLAKLSFPPGRDQLCVLPTTIVRRYLSQVIAWVQRGNFVIISSHKRHVALMAPMDDNARNAFAIRQRTPDVYKLTKAQIQKLRGRNV